MDKSDLTRMELHNADSVYLLPPLGRPHVAWVWDTPVVLNIVPLRLHVASGNSSRIGKSKEMNMGYSSLGALILSNGDQHKHMTSLLLLDMRPQSPILLRRLARSRSHLSLLLLLITPHAMEVQSRSYYRIS